MPGPVSPLPLSYDELPAGSDLRRELGANYSVTIVAPAGEPSEAARRVAAHATGAYSALLTGGGMALVLQVGLGLFPQVHRLDTRLFALAIGLFTCVAGGVFLLVWKVQYGARLDLLKTWRREAFVLHADRARLLIEAAGPRGDRSYEVPAGDFRRFSVITARWTPRDIPHLKISRHRGPNIRILIGRHPAEVRWAVAILSQAMDLGEK